MSSNPQQESFHYNGISSDHLSSLAVNGQEGQKTSKSVKMNKNDSTTVNYFPDYHKGIKKDYLNYHGPKAILMALRDTQQ